MTNDNFLHLIKFSAVKFYNYKYWVLLCTSNWSNTNYDSQV